MSITPSPYQPQVGIRHQFTWNQGVDEVGFFGLSNFPNPPTLTGPGVVMIGRQNSGSFSNPYNIGFAIYRGSDNQTQVFNFPPGMYTVGGIASTINAAFTGNPIAVVAPAIGSGSTETLNLIDKKPLSGDAALFFGVNVNSQPDAHKASQFTGWHWGGKSTAQTAAPLCQNTEENLSFIPSGGALSDVFQIPPGADTVALLVKVSTFSNTTAIMRLLWSDGQAPFNGSTASITLPPSTLLPPAKTYSDYGLFEMGVNPTTDANFIYTLETVSRYAVPGQSTPYFPTAVYTDTIDMWGASVLEVKPPPGMTQLRLDFPTTNWSSTDYPNGLAFFSRIQAYAWGVRRGKLCLSPTPPSRTPNWRVTCQATSLAPPSREFWGAPSRI